MPTGESGCLIGLSLCEKGNEHNGPVFGVQYMGRPVDQCTSPFLKGGLRGIPAAAVQAGRLTFPPSPFEQEQYPPYGAGNRQAGFTLLAVLFLVAAVGVGLAAVGTAWETAARREKETQLMFVGDQYRRAIQSYRQATPGTNKRYPSSLVDLLEDRRFPNVRRHLRRLYPDPITGSPEWGLVMRDGGIAGVHSLSQLEPIKKVGFSKADTAFAGASRYADWVFTPTIFPQENSLSRM